RSKRDWSSDVCSSDLPAEAAAARWEEIDLDAETWTIPAGRMKMRRDHVIPLCGQAMAVLETMKPISAHREHVFPSLKNPMLPMKIGRASCRGRVGIRE